MCLWSVFLVHAEPVPADMITRTAWTLSLASQVVSNKEGTIVGLLGASPGRHKHELIACSGQDEPRKGQSSLTCRAAQLRVFATQRNLI